MGRQSVQRITNHKQQNQAQVSAINVLTGHAALTCLPHHLLPNTLSNARGTNTPESQVAGCHVVLWTLQQSDHVVLLITGCD